MISLLIILKYKSLDYTTLSTSLLAEYLLKIMQNNTNTRACQQFMQTRCHSTSYKLFASLKASFYSECQRHNPFTQWGRFLFPSRNSRKFCDKTLTSTFEQTRATHNFDFTHCFLFPHPLRDQQVFQETLGNQNPAIQHSNAHNS